MIFEFIPPAFLEYGVMSVPIWYLHLRRWESVTWEDSRAYRLIRKVGKSP